MFVGHVAQNLYLWLVLRLLILNDIKVLSFLVLSVMIQDALHA